MTHRKAWDTISICALMIAVEHWLGPVVRRLPMGVALVLLSHLVAAARASEGGRAAVALTDRAVEIHRRCLLIDGHNDLPWKVRDNAESSFARLDIARPQKSLHTDIPRLRAGGVGAQFWAAYVPSETIHSRTAARYCLEQIDLILRMVQQYPEVFELATTAADIERIRANGKIASLIGIEGGHAIENSLALLRTYHRLGVRYITLTHSETTDWADSATDKPKHGGLAPLGEQVVREMNRLGMLVDIAHVSAETMHDVLAVARAPVIASHSSAYALAQHPRNVPDDVLKKIAVNGGVVMINFYPGFIVPEAARARKEMFEVGRKLKKQFPQKEQFEAALAEWRREHPAPTGSVHDVVDHIEHVVKTAGIDHVGLGSDFDGIDSVPQQLEDVSTFPFITQELLNRGYEEEQIRKVLGGNLLRVLRQAEAVASPR